MISSDAPLCARFSRTNPMSDTTQSDGSIVETKIEVNLNRLTQLFNSLDPSRFTSATLIRTPKTTLLVRPKRAPASALFGLSSTCPLTNYPIPVPPISQRPFTTTSLIAKLTNADDCAFYSVMVESLSSQGWHSCLLACCCASWRSPSGAAQLPTSRRGDADYWMGRRLAPA